MRYIFWPVALAAAYIAAAQGTYVGNVIPLGPPEILVTRGAGVHVRQEGQVSLRAGENRLLIDVAQLQTEAASVRLQVLEPPKEVRLESALLGPQPGQMLWTLQAERPLQARLRLEYEISYLQADIAYTMLLDPARRQLNLEAVALLTNNGKQELKAARVTLPSGHQIKLHLPAGQSIQQKLFVQTEIPYEIVYLYDYSRFKDSVRTWLVIAGQARQEMAWPAGKTRLYATAPEAAPTFVADITMPYAPRGEKLELDVGPAPDLAVLRTRLRSDQVNVRTDVYRKLALFDLEEEYELELSNQRQTPVVFVIQEHIPGDWQLVKSSHPAQQINSDTLEFRVRVSGEAKEKLTYFVKRLNVEP